MSRPTAIVYIDGFNLYYRALRHNGNKWLNIESLFDELLPDYDVRRLYYFTADIRAKARPSDPRAPDRQKAYLNALTSLRRVTIVRGNFLVSKTNARLRLPNRFFGIPLPKKLREDTWVPVWKVEEKGSD